MRTARRGRAFSDPTYPVRFPDGAAHRSCLPRPRRRSRGRRLKATRACWRDALIAARQAASASSCLIARPRSSTDAWAEASIQSSTSAWKGRSRPFAALRGRPLGLRWCWNNGDRPRRWPAGASAPMAKNSGASRERHDRPVTARQTLSEDRAEFGEQAAKLLDLVRAQTPGLQRSEVALRLRSKGGSTCWRLHERVEAPPQRPDVGPVAGAFTEVALTGYGQGPGWRPGPGRLRAGP